MSLPEGLDLLGLRDSGFELDVRIGGTDLTAAASGFTASTSLNKLPTASLNINDVLMAGQPLDYFGLVTIAGVGLQHLFSGHVVTATPDGGALQVSCQTHPGLQESRLGGLELINHDPGEALHLMTRLAGLPETQINVAGLENLPVEVVQVVVPVRGLQLRRTMRLGSLVFLDPSGTAPLLADFRDSELIAQLREADCHALYRVVGQRMFDVETDALAAVDVALAWWVTRARFGLAHLPDGTAQAFARTRALARPQRGAVVLVRGLDSNRAWLRVVETLPSDAPLELGTDNRDWMPPDPTTLSATDRLALLTLRRAATDGDVLERVQALWEAIEFYVSGISVEDAFDSTEAKRVRKAIPKDVAPALRDRALSLLAKINDPPLMVKVREATRRDGVPLAEEDYALLARVRRVRNHTTHGRSAEVPLAEDVDHAVSIVARLLMFRLARRPSP